MVADGGGEGLPQLFLVIIRGRRWGAQSPRILIITRGGAGEPSGGIHTAGQSDEDPLLTDYYSYYEGCPASQAARRARRARRAATGADAVGPAAGGGGGLPGDPGEEPGDPGEESEGMQ